MFHFNIIQSYWNLYFQYSFLLFIHTPVYIMSVCRNLPCQDQKSCKLFMNTLIAWYFRQYSMTITYNSCKQYSETTLSFCAVKYYKYNNNRYLSNMQQIDIEFCWLSKKNRGIFISIIIRFSIKIYSALLLE